MQLTLAFVEALPAQPTLLSDRIDAEAHVEAVRILARLIAQAIAAAEQKDTTDE
jgi:hypothetical protein